MDDLKLYVKSKDVLEALMNTVCIFTDTVKIKFGISKCATLVMKRGRKVKDSGIQMSGEIAMRYLSDRAYMEY